jgi:arginyl-tRNA synthetase
MNNIFDELRDEIRKVTAAACSRCIEAGTLPLEAMPEINLEVPRERGFGDFSTNLAMQLAKPARMAPRKIADLLMAAMRLEDTEIEKVEVAGPGFINFTLRPHWLAQAMRLIREKGENYGQLEVGRGKRVNVEFVSANPTGPLHMGNARGGALGDCIAGVLSKAGYEVTREFYINDAGNQIEKLGLSLEARYLQLLQGEETVEFPEDAYHGEDIVDHARAYIEVHGDALLSVPSEERRKILAGYALPINLERIREGLARYGISYDVWFSEKSLYDSGEVAETLAWLRENGFTVEKEGALWLSGEKTGLEKDEVLVRANGFPTYMAADIAYHRNKLQKRGFDWAIDLWGADHHGHVARMHGAMSPFGVKKEQLTVVLFQLVRLYRNGEIARMSKRTGKAISLGDLLDEVGRDAARFFFNLKAAGSHLDFDLDLAVKQSNDNPVFYVQYAHARISNILRRLSEEDGITLKPVEQVDLSVLTAPEEVSLMRKLAEYPEEVGIAAASLEPSRLTRYVMDVAAEFHSFYAACRVKGEAETLLQARLTLVECTRVVIRNVLDLIRIEAPERM